MAITTLMAVLIRLLAVLVCLVSLAPAQRYPFEVFNSRSGLHDPVVNGLVKDRSGFLWVATETGLYRFDGHHFERFNGPRELASEIVKSLGTDDRGNLWIFTYRGLHLLRNGDLSPVASYPVTATRNAMAAHPGGVMFLASRKGLLRCTASAAGPPVCQVFPNPFSAPGAVVDAVLTAKDGAVWSIEGQKVFRYRDGQWRQFPLPQLPQAQRWASLAQDGEGAIWARSAAAVVRMAPAESVFSLVSLPFVEVSREVLLATDHAGRLLLVANNGLLRRESGQWRSISAANGLPSPLVSAILPDPEGVLWLGLDGGGLAAWRGYGVWEVQSSESGLENSNVTALYQSRAGDLWAGTSGGLYRYDEPRRRWTAPANSAPFRMEVRTIYEDGEGWLWLAGNAGFVARFHPATGRSSFVTGPAGRHWPAVHDFHQDAAGRMYAATQSGMFRSQSVAGPFLPVHVSGRSDPDVLRVAPSSDGSLLLGYAYGLQLWRDGSAVNIPFPNTIHWSRPREIVPTSDGTAWICFWESRGARQVRIRGTEVEVVKELTTADGLPSNRVTSMALDSSGALWLGTNRGLARYHQGHVTSWSMGNGIAAEQGNQSSLLVLSPSHVLLGTSKGLAIFRGDPAPYRNKLQPVAVQVAGNASPVPISDGSRLAIPEGPLQISVAAASTTIRDRVVLEYRISGYADSWMPYRGSLLEHQMPAGSYRITVRARDPQLQWLAGELAFDLTVNPPWYRTSGAHALWFFLAVACAFGLVRWREGHLRRRQQELECQVAARTAELEQEKSRAEHATAAKSKFLAVMSHEIRTPLNGILGAGALLGFSDLNADQRDLVDTIETSGAAMRDLIGDILDFSRIEAGKLELASNDFSIHRLVDGIVSSLRPMAIEKGLRLVSRNSLPPESYWRGYEGRLRQVILNLANNAVKFTASGHVTIEVCLQPGPAPQAVLFAVSDSGEGIPGEEIDRIFAPFEQRDGSHSRPHGGVGLGLAIARTLVELMGGRIEVDSRPGSGSRFYFALPLDSAVEESEPPPDGEPVPFAGARVLLVEDNGINRLVARKLLMHLGLDVVCATNGLEAIAALPASRCDLVLMDCSMPVMDGYECTARIRATEPSGDHIPIIALTANAFVEDREKCFAVGMDDFLSKPLRPGDLRRVLARWLPVGRV
jgi:signal transduction histidine kinase/CheY-like chemotaxis protein/ligand-binding sensor domain-containing protein